MVASESELISKAWEISPYNGIAYGAIVVFLILGVVWMNGQRKRAISEAEEWQRRYIEMLMKGANTMERASEKQDVIVEIKAGVLSNQYAIEAIRQNIEKISINDVTKRN